MCSKYNGWSNHQTWLAALWMDNSQPDQEWWQERAQDCARQLEGYDAVNALADEISDYWSDYAPKLDGLYADLMTTALASIDYHEIAATLIGDYTEIVIEQ